MRWIYCLFHITCYQITHMEAGNFCTSHLLSNGKCQNVMFSFAISHRKITDQLKCYAGKSYILHNDDKEMHNCTSHIIIIRNYQ